MTFKKGGGNKPQPFNEKNGQYIRCEQCVKDEEDLHLIYFFGIKRIPVYPINNIHDKQYKKNYYELFVKKNNPFIHKDKIIKYLLVYNPRRDKSKILYSLGYTMENWSELLNQIINNTNFNKFKICNNDNYFTIDAECYIINKNNQKKFYCTTCWFVEKNNTLRFVTLLPEEFKNDSN